MIKVSASLFFFFSGNKLQNFPGKSFRGRSPESLGSSHWFFLGASAPPRSRLLGGWTNRGVSCGLNADSGATAGDRVLGGFGCWSQRGWMERLLVVGPAGSGEEGDGPDRGWGPGAGGRELGTGSRGVGAWGLEARATPGCLWPRTASATQGGSVLMSTRAYASPKPPTLQGLRASDAGFER